jgi:hypothetical protein
MSDTLYAPPDLKPWHYQLWELEGWKITEPILNTTIATIRAHNGQFKAGFTHAITKLKDLCSCPEHLEFCECGIYTLAKKLEGKIE